MSRSKNRGCICFEAPKLRGTRSAVCARCNRVLALWISETIAEEALQAGIISQKDILERRSKPGWRRALITVYPDLGSAFARTGWKAEASRIRDVVSGRVK